MTQINPGLATPAQAAKFLCLHKNSIFNLIRQKKIPAVKIGASVRIPWAWLHQQAGGAK